MVVSGGLALRSLADRVLMPAMGWTRNYHCYIFNDVADGAIYGPIDSRAVDKMHAHYYHAEFMDDRDVKVCR